MPRNGSGTFSRVHDWTDDEANSIDITASRFDADMDDMATAITNSVAKNGETTMTGNLPMGSNRITGLANGTARTDAATVAQIQDGGAIWAGTAGGTADAITLTVTPAITAYTAGQSFEFVAASDNTGPMTVVVSGISTPADLTKDGATPLARGDVKANCVYRITRDGTRFQIRPSITGGKQTIFLPASALRPSASGGAALPSTVATTANRPDLPVMYFDATTQEYAQFHVAMPKSWDEGTITAQFLWTHASTTTNFGVVWNLQGVAVSDDDTIDVAYGTAQQVADTGGTTNDLYITAETSAITIGGTPAEGDVVFFRVSRVTGDASDTMAIDAGLVGIKLFFTTNSINDL